MSKRLTSVLLTVISLWQMSNNYLSKIIFHNVKKKTYQFKVAKRTLEFICRETIRMHMQVHNSEKRDWGRVSMPTDISRGLGHSLKTTVTTQLLQVSFPEEKRKGTSHTTEYLENNNKRPHTQETLSLSTRSYTGYPSPSVHTTH